MGAQNFIFASKFPPNGVFLVPNFVFFDENFRKKENFPTD